MYLNKYIEPIWPAPSNVKAFSTTRRAGYSKSPYDNFNLAKHVDDFESSVIKNRNQLKEELKIAEEPYWLEQCHTTDIINLDSVKDRNIIYTADGSYTSLSHRACVVMTADCLPILLCDKKGGWVAAVHAGWRGLADGIIQNTVKRYPNETKNLIAWLGPAIGPQQFEVGEDVRQLFVKKQIGLSSYFVKNTEDKYWCDLYGIAKEILSDYSVSSYGGGSCTFEEKDIFYSYRREGKTGRMASMIWLTNGGAE